VAGFVYPLVAAVDLYLGAERRLFEDLANLRPPDPHTRVARGVRLNEVVADRAMKSDAGPVRKEEHRVEHERTRVQGALDADDADIDGDDDE